MLLAHTNSFIPHHRYDAREDIPEKLWGKLMKLDSTPFLQSLVMFMWKGSKKAAKVANEQKPQKDDVESTVKGCDLFVPVVLVHTAAVCDHRHPHVQAHI